MTQEAGVARAKANGQKMTVAAYPSGAPGIKISLEEMARLMREARHDPDLMGWATDVLSAKGLDGRKRPGPGIKVQAEALLEALRKQTIYTPDPAGSEKIQAPHVTLCLRDLCIRGGDCDDLSTLLGGAMLSIGLQAYVVKQSYGPEHQEHVLVGFIDENGKKWYADPSTNRPVTSYSQAVDEIWIDPLDQVGSIGVASAEIVTLGRVHHRDLFIKDGRWWEYAHDSWWMHTGLGQWIDVGLGASENTVIAGYSPVTDDRFRTGLRYRVKLSVAYKYNPDENDWARANAKSTFASKFFIESHSPQGPAQFIPGIEEWLVTYLLQGVALKNLTVAELEDVGGINSRAFTVKYLGGAVQASATPNPNPPVPNPNPNPGEPIPVIPTRQPESDISFGSAILGAAGFGALLAVGYVYVTKRKKK